MLSNADNKRQGPVNGFTLFLILILLLLSENVLTLLKILTGKKDEGVFNE